MLRPQTSAVIVLCLLVLAAVPVSATSVTNYSNLASWQIATTGYQSVNFESYASGSSYPSGLLDTGVDFIGLVGSLQIYDTSTVGWMNFGTVKAAYVWVANPSTPPSIHIVLPASITAVALELFTANPNAGTMLLTVAGTQYTVPTGATPMPAFWGLTSDTPFTYVDIALASPSGGQYAFIDNFRFGTAQAQGAEAPEAATFLLIGAGLIGLAVGRKRLLKRRSAERFIGVACEASS